MDEWAQSILYSGTAAFGVREVIGGDWWNPRMRFFEGVVESAKEVF